MSPHALFQTISGPGVRISGFSFTFRGRGGRMSIKKAKTRLRLFMPKGTLRTADCTCPAMLSFSVTVERQNLYHIL